MSIVIMLTVSFVVFYLINRRSKLEAIPIRSNSIPQKLPVDDRSW